jgi:CheY-like chemotaxis protein
MKKILIVDDQDEIRDLVEVTLGIENYKILQAQNGEEALETTHRVKPNLILMDVMMPGGIDGYMATKMIKNNVDTKDIKVLILTSRGQKSDIELGYKSGADAYFIKPFSPLSLIKKVEEILY